MLRFKICVNIKGDAQEKYNLVISSKIRKKYVIRITQQSEHADAFRSKNKCVCAKDVQNRVN
jgi:hypothetical protein